MRGWGSAFTLTPESGPPREGRTQAKSAGSTPTSNLLPSFFLLNVTWRALRGQRSWTNPRSTLCPDLRKGPPPHTLSPLQADLSLLLTAHSPVRWRSWAVSMNLLCLLPTRSRKVMDQRESPPHCGRLQERRDHSQRQGGGQVFSDWEGGACPQVQGGNQRKRGTAEAQDFKSFQPLKSGPKNSGHRIRDGYKAS